jgi:hypothetical protein
MYFSLRNAPEIKDETPPKFTPRKMTFVVTEVEKPKRKKKKYYNNKKKATLAESATPVAKRPVGRPRKTVE